MKRREFGVLAGSNLAATASTLAVSGQLASSNAKQLDISLTPLGAERAGNADGSIPAWTGGLTAPALPPGQPVDVQLFADEKPLATIDTGNMQQYAALLTPGTQEMMKTFGFRIQLYQTHRTAAAPQYVYDNTVKNAANAKLDPAGGQYGFTGAFGGVPFPVIDTANPLAGGAQLIWNHLTSWQGYSGQMQFAPVFVVVGGKLVLTAAATTDFEYPFYDPAGSVQSHESGLDFDGFYSKAHSFFKAPDSIMGQEQLVWLSTNINVHPDITWALLNGQGRVRKAPDMIYGTPDPFTNGMANIDENTCFSGNPAQYDWNYIGKQEMLVPYNCNEMHFCAAADLLRPNFPNPDNVRWEKHRVWVVEAQLRPDAHNVLARRRFYIDEDNWAALLGEAYNTSGALIRYYTVYNRCVPSMPASCMLGSMVHDLRSGNYVFAGSVNYETFVADIIMSPQPESDFEPMQMAAIASY